MYLLITFTSIIITWFAFATIFTKIQLNNCNYKVSMAVSLIFGFILFIVMTMINFTMDSYQQSDYETLKQSMNKIDIYKDKTQELTNTFKVLLSEKYPEHEKQIFKDMSLQNIDIYFVKFPEIKAIEGFTTLVTKIESLNNELYQEKINQTKITKNIRFRLINPWVFNSIITKVPEKYVNLVYN